ncbi:MAG: hypoxanthine phosphoribosyltransferase [Alphaproteobacteria bacterium]|nr:hypoxanthine phosphoribosyltransferase [Alphaproteobacteria bacterium]
MPQTLITETHIRERVATLAAEIAGTLTGEVMLVSLLRGAFMFTADLVRELSRHGIRPRIDFMTLSSYGDGTESSGKVVVTRDISDDVNGRQVLIIDDILESGRTRKFAHDLMLERGARSAQIAVLLEKPGQRAVPLEADFVGFVIEDKFVVGYGLDYANAYRELPFIGYFE